MTYGDDNLMIRPPNDHNMAKANEYIEFILRIPNTIKGFGDTLIYRILLLTGIFTVLSFRSGEL